MATLPTNYFCKACDAVNDHWIMDCPMIKVRSSVFSEETVLGGESDSECDESERYIPKPNTFILNAWEVGTIFLPINELFKLRSGVGDEYESNIDEHISIIIKERLQKELLWIYRNNDKVLNKINKQGPIEMYTKHVLLEFDPDKCGHDFNKKGFCHVCLYTKYNKRSLLNHIQIHITEKSLNDLKKIFTSTILTKRQPLSEIMKMLKDGKFGDIIEICLDERHHESMIEFELFEDMEEFPQSKQYMIGIKHFTQLDLGLIPLPVGFDRDDLYADTIIKFCLTTKFILSSDVMREVLTFLFNQSWWVF